MEQGIRGREMKPIKECLERRMFKKIPKGYQIQLLNHIQFNNNFFNLCFNKLANITYNNAFYNFCINNINLLNDIVTIISNGFKNKLKIK